MSYSLEIFRLKKIFVSLVRRQNDLEWYAGANITACILINSSACVVSMRCYRHNTSVIHRKLSVNNYLLTIDPILIDLSTDVITLKLVSKCYLTIFIRLIAISISHNGWVPH